MELKLFYVIDKIFFVLLISVGRQSYSRFGDWGWIRYDQSFIKIWGGTRRNWILGNLYRNSKNGWDLKKKNYEEWGWLNGYMCIFAEVLYTWKLHKNDWDRSVLSSNPT